MRAITRSTAQSSSTNVGTPPQGIVLPLVPVFRQVFEHTFAPPLALIPALTTASGLAEYLGYVIEGGKKAARKETKQAAELLRSIDPLLQTVVAYQALDQLRSFLAWPIHAYLSSTKGDSYPVPVRDALSSRPAWPIDQPVAGQMGNNLLHLATLCSPPELVAHFIRNNADVNARANEGLTASQYACRVENQFQGYEKLELLVRAGADFEVSDEYGHTPLHEAAFVDSIRCARLLLSLGASPNAKNKDGQTPFDFAAEYDSPGVLALRDQSGLTEALSMPIALSAKKRL